MDKNKYCRMIRYISFPLLGILLLPIAIDTAVGVGAITQRSRVRKIGPRVERRIFEERIRHLPPRVREEVLKEFRKEFGIKTFQDELEAMKRRKLIEALRKKELKIEIDRDIVKPIKRRKLIEVPSIGMQKVDPYRAAEDSEKAGKLEEALILYSKSLTFGATRARTRIEEISGTLIRHARNDYKNRKWQSCHQKLSQLLEVLGALFLFDENIVSPLARTSDTMEQRMKEAMQLLERNLLTWGKDSYRKAREDGSWADARVPYETLMNDKYASEVNRLEAYERLKRIDNLDAVYKMPGREMVIDVLMKTNELGIIHIATKTTDLLMKSEKIEVLPRSKIFQKALQDVQRILLTPNVEKKMGDVDCTRAFPDKAVWRDPSLEEAVKTIDALSKQKFSLRDSTAVLLLPRNESQQELLGLTWSDDNRKRVWEAAENFINKNSGIDIVNHGGLLERALEKLNKKSIHEKLLKALKKKKNVLIFFAHTEPNLLRTPDGKILTSEEVSRLDLHRNKPNVFLFCCEGGKPGGKSDASLSLQQAFKTAGANAVWAFEEKVDACQAIYIASELLNRMKIRKSILDAVEEIVREFPKYRIRLKARRENDIGQQDRFYA